MNAMGHEGTGVAQTEHSLNITMGVAQKAHPAQPNTACAGNAYGQEGIETGHKHAQWLSMFGITLRPDRARQTEQDLMLEAAAAVASSCLRGHVTMPASPEDTQISLRDAQTGGRLPVVSCGFRCCTYSVPGQRSPKKHIRTILSTRGIRCYGRTCYMCMLTRYVL